MQFFLRICATWKFQKLYDTVESSLCVFACFVKPKINLNGSDELHNDKVLSFYSHIHYIRKGIEHFLIPSEAHLAD